MSDVSGSTSWRYDARGSLAREEKTVTGVGTFTTLWTYNAAGMASAMYYPGGDNGQTGERVQYRYYPQNLIQDTLGSEGANNYYYLQKAEYDAAGRADLLKLGATSLAVNPVLLRDYRYHDWNRPNGQGRLMWIKSGAYASPTSLQDLRFYTGSDASPSPSYDAVGNILGIYDYKAGNPQTQSFAYDDLDRLTSAQAAGGTLGLHGVYNQETYAYDSLGRLTGLPSLGTYTYNPSVSCAAGNRTLPHAVAAAGNNSYGYDCNGNMTTRTLGGNNTYTFTYDNENRLSGVSGAATNSYFYDGDSKRVKEVTYENLASGIPLTSGGSLYFAEAATDGDTYPNSGVGSSGEFAYTASGGNQYAQLDLGATYSVDKIKVWHYFVDGRSYHGVKLQVSANGTTWTTLYDSAVQGEYVETSSGKTHTFSAQNVRYVREYLNGSTINAEDHWVEIEVFGSRTNVMIGDYFEWNENSGTMVKYYYAGSERIAMREGTGTLTTGLKWLLGDHLGSTSISADGASGAKQSELRYKPFGELRFAWGTTTTSLRYTGQRAEGTGLYDYGARFFDPLLGRFIQPDPLIPEPGNPLAWDKYAYAGNNPIRYNDPTGHWLDAVFDIISIGADIVDIAQNGLNWSNGLALAADVASVVIPGVTGAGALVRALTHVDDAVDAVKAVDRVGDVVDAVRTAENAGDAVQAANQVDNLGDAAKCAFNSFSAETVVATADGEEAIRELDEGDLVLAYDPDFGVTGLFTVTATISHLDLLVVDLTIDGERIETTPEHPFYVEGYGWVLAQDLWIGAPVSQLHAGVGVVESISLALRPQRMYNLTVAQAHTFFVGQGQWLVHNQCGSFDVGSFDDLAKNTDGNAGVYSLRNPDGEVVRVGRTNDLTRRAGEYGRDPNYFDLDFKREFYSNDYATQRGLEQVLYDRFQPPLNYNRPISLRNPNRQRYLDAARRFIGE